MANVIQIKKNAWGSTDPPADSDVIYGELAWENDSKRLFIGRQSTSGGTVVATHIGGKTGIANNNTVIVNDDDAADNDYAKFTASGIEGRSYAEVKTDLSLNNVDNTSLATWAGTSNITTLGTIGTGTWNGAAIPVANGGTGSTSASDARTALGLGSSSDVQFANATVSNLTVNGTTTTVNSTTMTVDDPILTLGGDSAPSSDDNKDRGVEFRYHSGSAAKVGFFGWDDSNSRFVFYKDATNSSEVFSGTVASIQADLVGNVTGYADTATALATARTIGGVSFNGTANIDLPGVNTAGNQDTTGNAATATALATARTIGGVSFDGTANINLAGVNAAGNQDTTGNAATATALATARTIGGVSFDGTANIDLAGVNTTGNQDTTGQAGSLASSFVIDGGTF